MIDLDAKDKHVAGLRRLHVLPNETVYASIPVDELDAMAQALREARNVLATAADGYRHMRGPHDAGLSVESAAEDWLARWFGKST